MASPVRLNQSFWLRSCFCCYKSKKKEKNGERTRVAEKEREIVRKHKSKFTSSAKMKFATDNMCSVFRFSKTFDECTNTVCAHALNKCSPSRPLFLGNIHCWIFIPTECSYIHLQNHFGWFLIVQLVCANFWMCGISAYHTEASHHTTQSDTQTGACTKCWIDYKRKNINLDEEHP